MIRPTKEQIFILSFLRYALGYESLENITRMASEPLNWEEVAIMAKHHGISPILYDSLQKNKQSPIARQHLEERLAKEYIANCASILLHERALKAIIAHFEERGLTFTVHKGLGLSALLYSKPELRPCGEDFDILIKKPDYIRAKSLLEEIGYQLEDIRYAQFEIVNIGEVRFVKYMSGKKLTVDLHADFIANAWGKVSGFEVRDFWDNLSRVKYHDFYIPCLPVEAYLLFLSIHCAANHIFDRLIIFCDLDLFVRKYRSKIDWGYLAGYAGTNGAKKTLYHALNYCRQLLGTPVPVYFLKEIKPGALSIYLVPEKFLLLRSRKPPESLKRYLHIILLDNPFHFFKSAFIFVKRFFARIFIKIYFARP